jgi:hypothetical protein
MLQGRPSILRHSRQTHTTAQLPSKPTIKKLKSPNNVADSFNTFFLTITGKLTTHEILKVDAFSLTINSAYPNTIRGRLPVTDSEISKKTYLLVSIHKYIAPFHDYLLTNIFFLFKTFLQPTTTKINATNTPSHTHLHIADSKDYISHASPSNIQGVWWWFATM